MSDQPAVPLVISRPAATAYASPRLRPLDVARFANERQTAPQLERLTWGEVCALHQRHDVRPNKSGPMLGGYRCDGARKNENVPYRSLIQLDIDTEGDKDPLTKRITKVTKAAPPLKGIRDKIDEYEWIAVSSHNHAPSEGVVKFRVVMLPDRDILQAEYQALLEALDELLGGVLDRGAWQWSQAFYLPSCPVEFEGEAFFVENSGVPVPVDALVERGREIERLRSASLARGPSKLAAAAMGGLSGGSAGPETPEGLARMTSALYALDPNMKKPTGWLDAVFSVAAHDWPSGYEIARGWSAQGREFEPAKFGVDWASYDRDRIDHTRHEKLYRMAKEAGWTDPAAAPTTTLDDLAAGDMANAKRFAKDHAGELRYVHPKNTWMRWDGSRWAWCTAGEDMEAAKATAARLLREATESFITQRDDSSVNAKLKHARAANNERQLKAMLKLAESDPTIAVGSMRDLDADPWLVNAVNGTVDLRSGSLLAHNPAHLITKECAANYDPEASCPRWLQFLDEILLGDADLIGFVQRALGYSLTGDVTEEVLFFLFGFGANGKSVFCNVATAILADYAVTAPSTMLSLQRNEDKGRATPEMLRLAGARFVNANETQSGERVDERAVKTLVSRERITCRALYGDYVEIDPTHKLWVRGNHKPIVRGDDDGIWRRIVLIPFLRTFAPEEMDTSLEAALLKERDGILAWMVQGCLSWQQQGLNPPQVVKWASAEYRSESDILGQWMADECVTGPTLYDNQAAMYAAYQEACKRDGYHALKKNSFTRKLKERRHPVDRLGDKWIYQGIQLKTTKPFHDDVRKWSAKELKSLPPEIVAALEREVG